VSGSGTRELIAAADAPHDWSLDLADGEDLPGEGPYPTLIVEESHVLEPERIVWQQVVVTALRTNSDVEERFVVGRAVAVFPPAAEGEPPREVEIGDRVVVPAALMDGGPDLSACAACGAPLHAGFTLIDDLAYCPGCVLADTEE